MGLIDLFKRRKNKPLLLEEGRTKDKEKQKDEKELDVQIFSKKMEDSRIQYSIVLNSQEDSVLVGKIYSSSNDDITKRQNVQLKNIANKIKDAIEPIATISAKTQYAITKAKSEAKEKIQGMADKEGITLTKDVIQYINQCNNPSNRIEERHARMSDEEWKRLQELESIKTPDDAYAHRDSLIAYMKKTEKVPFNPIVEANVKSLQEGKRLDDETVKSIAKNMEKLGNEDGLLYSVYLKIEEKRIWRQLQTRLAQYSNNSDNKEVVNEIYQLSGILEELDKYELPDREKGFSPSVLEYVINEMEEKNIENYIENVKEKDTFLARSINTKCPLIQDKTEMLQFLYARVASLGQLSYKSVSDGNDVLRNFVANTNFKHENNRETKEFLLTVANIEKASIQDKYVVSLDEYSKTKRNSLKERINIEKTPVINLSEQDRSNHTEKRQEVDRTA